MFETLKLKLASALFRYAFPVYHPLYFRFKTKKDGSNMQLVKKMISPGNTVLDIGANIGFYGKFLAECVGGSGRVYCFEPDTTNFRHLKKELGQYKNVTLVQKAVAAASGTLTLYVSDLLNVDHRAYEPENYSSKYHVEKTSVDDFVGGKFPVHFIKMDIQGFETDALKGMRNTIAANPELSIFTEFWPHGLKSAGSSALEMYDQVSQLGFKVYRVSNGMPLPLSREEAGALKVEYFTDLDVLLTRRVLS